MEKTPRVLLRAPGSQGFPHAIDIRFPEPELSLVMVVAVTPDPDESKPHIAFVTFPKRLPRLPHKGVKPPTNPMSSASLTTQESETPSMICRYCGQVHRAVALRPRQRALCTRCGSLLALGSARRDSAFAYAVAGLALLPPALALPFVAVEKLGNERVQRLFGGAHALWQQGMPVLGAWVSLCGIVAPATFLLAIAMLSTRRSTQHQTASLARRIAVAVEHWAMPEVQVLAVLIAMTKLGTLVNVHLEAGFWCYVAMALALLMSWRKYEWQSPAGAFPERREPERAPES